MERNLKEYWVFCDIYLIFSKEMNETDILNFHIILGYFSNNLVMEKYGGKKAAVNN